MNYPKAQQTGEMGELKLKLLFTEWSWTVGEDLIDVGYDLIVEPLISEFNGHRFLVQVKATTRHSKSAGITASVNRNRLRQYAKNPIPVFIVRQSADGKLYWIHAQEWAKKNPKHLIGDGKCSVKFPASQILNDQAIFSDYLRGVFKPLAEKPSALIELAAEQNKYLSSIDSRFDVQVGIHNGTQSYVISAKSEPVKIHLELQTSGAIDNQGLEEAIRFGLPADINANSLKITGSTLFKKVGFPDKLSGPVSIRPTSWKAGEVCLFPCSEPIMSVTPWSFAAIMYRGNAGISIQTKDEHSMLKFDLRAAFDVDPKVSFALNESRLYTEKISDLTDLRQMGDWADEVLQEQSIRLVTRFKGIKASLHATASDINQANSILTYLVWLGRLHKIAAALDSEFILDKEFHFSQRDLNAIEFVHWLLKGERREVPINSFDIKGAESFNSAEISGRLYMRTYFEITLGAQLFGSIPVVVELEGFKYEALSSPDAYRFSKGPDGKAIMYYGNHFGSQ